jgi:hypothetical protein
MPPAGNIEDILETIEPIESKVKIMSNPNDLFNVSPGDTVRFLDFYIKFYDFTIPRQTKYKDILSHYTYREVCDWKIAPDYYIEAIKDASYMISISFIPRNWPKETFAAFIIATVKNDKDIYYKLLCARNFYSERDKTEFNPSFGIYLQCILSKYLYSAGYKNIYLDASSENLLGYYNRWGFLLGKKECNTKDEITEQHIEAIKNGIIPQFYNRIEKSDYKTNAGYRMKFCNFNFNVLCEYARQKMHQVWEYFSNHPDSLISA